MGFSNRLELMGLRRTGGGAQWRSGGAEPWPQERISILKPDTRLKIRRLHLVQAVIVTMQMSERAGGPLDRGVDRDAAFSEFCP